MPSPMIVTGFHRGLERATDIVAVASVATWVDPDLFMIVGSVSKWAALLMPIFGVAWLAVQIWAKLYDLFVKIFRSNSRGSQ